MLKIGDKVKVCIKPGEPTATPAVRKYNKAVSVISKVSYAGSSYYYELLGCESDFGIPFSFAEEWLMPMESEED